MKICRAWLPVLAWMGVIYWMSAMTGEVSSQQSGMVVRILTAAYGFFTGGAQMTQETTAFIGLLIRKAAHMGEYALLAMLSARAFRLSGAKRPFLSAFLLCALYAAGDEIHQAFVPDRGPSPVDVLIDSAGAAAGLLVTRVYLRLRA